MVFVLGDKVARRTVHLLVNRYMGTSMCPLIVLRERDVRTLLALVLFHLSVAVPSRFSVVELKPK